MLALPRIFVLVERRAVELRQAVRVFREVAGHPVEDHANARRVTRVDEQLEVIRRTEAARRREEPRHLIAPRSAVRMLEDRQQLDVREAHVLHVGHHLLGHLAIRQRSPSAAVLADLALAGRDVFPRRRVHLVDRDRTIEAAVRDLAGRHPAVVAPRVALRVGRRRQRRGGGRRLESTRVRIGFQERQRRVTRADLDTCSVRPGRAPG